MDYRSDIIKLMAEEKEEEYEEEEWEEEDSEEEAN